MNIVMTKTLQTQQKIFKETDPKYFFKVNIKTVKEYHMLSHFSGSELKVLLAIASFLDKYSKAYPSQKQISILTGLKVSTISRAIGKLATKEFLGEKVLVVIKGKAEGNRFANNRYDLSTKTGITFGDKDHSTESQESIKHLDQTKENYTINENQLINQNKEVSSFKKKKDSSNPESAQVPDLHTLRKDESFNFYAKAISKQKPFNGDLLYAERAFRKSIERMGYVNWLELVKTLKWHRTPQDLLEHVRKKISQENMTYEEAMKDWNSQF